MIWKAETDQQRAYLIDYIAKRNDVTAEDLVAAVPYSVFAAISDDKIKGAILYINYRGPSVEMACAGEPGWLTKGNLKQIFGYPFLVLKVRRVTAIVHRKNKRSRKLVEGLGYKLEGVCKHGFQNGDAMIYGLIRSQCKWIESYEKRTQTREPLRNGAEGPGLQ